jgi:hypothetical protein
VLSILSIAGTTATSDSEASNIRFSYWKLELVFQKRFQVALPFPELQSAKLVQLDGSISTSGPVFGAFWNRMTSVSL